MAIIFIRPMRHRPAEVWFQDRHTPTLLIKGMHRCTFGPVPRRKSLPRLFGQKVKPRRRRLAQTRAKYGSTGTRRVRVRPGSPHGFSTCRIACHIATKIQYGDRRGLPT